MKRPKATRQGGCGVTGRPGFGDSHPRHRVPAWQGPPPGNSARGRRRLGRWEISRRPPMTFATGRRPNGVRPSRTSSGAARPRHGCPIGSTDWPRERRPWPSSARPGRVRVPGRGQREGGREMAISAPANDRRRETCASQGGHKHACPGSPEPSEEWRESPRSCATRMTAQISTDQTKERRITLPLLSYPCSSVCFGPCSAAPWAFLARAP
jgi:hypothetical protein